MTMTTKEMIEVLQAYERGERVQYKHVGQWKEDWLDLAADNPSWNFRYTNYRIAKPEPRKIKVCAWFDGSALMWRAESIHLTDNWIRVPAEDKEIQID